MRDKLIDLRDVIVENTVATLLIGNILMTFVYGHKILTREIDENFTRIVIDHNSKEDLATMKKEVCYRGLKSVLSKSVDKKFVEVNLANNLIDSNYTNFNVDDTESISVAMRSDVVCTAMLRYEDRTIRAFDIDIIEDRENAIILYAIQDINETLVREGV